MCKDKNKKSSNNETKGNDKKIGKFSKDVPVTKFRKPDPPVKVKGE